ncbi:MAG: methylated-DNA--[protein]-cysteine S-methyltransferase [Acidimicrobiaceae bacterium]|nr:methylated-DNA--[protein]-cysteine S-methyltransferase [Acidimicrobiaceae bacterium]MDB4103045.1 methylated-DNA--[protein]-cysteine S-methyltransferase [Acidimicrobiales bacterium]HAY67964.1 cysteine methyltransferase [Acidimicrobiaceae bacterium]
MPLRLADYLVSPRRCTVDSPVGPLMVIADNTGITHILFPTHTLADLGLVSEDVPEAKDDPVLLNAARQLAEYFDGDRTAFDLPLHVEGNDFEVDVWFAMRSIPYGETISYGKQSDIAGHPGAFQAVGAANGRNPIPIVVPCHRVVGSDGSLVGFGGGLDVKRFLLDLESGVQRLF